MTWLPYCGPAPTPAEWLGRWNLDPVLLVALGLGLALAVRSARLRGEPAWPAWAGFAVLVALFVSPFCALTSALFSARVFHHVALTAVAAPLLARALPAPQAMRAGGLMVPAGVHAIAFWLWHAPPAYSWALSNNVAYWLMQGSLLCSAVVLWWAIRRAAVPSGVAVLLFTMVHMGLLGALLTFAGSPLYAPHLTGPVAWGYTPLEDQQLAGLIMWAPGAALYLGAAMALLGRWLAAAERPVVTA